MSLPFIPFYDVDKKTVLRGKEYKVNSLGYRTEYEDLPTEKYLIAIGCSNTFGEGLENKHRYSNYLQNKIGKPVINIGLPGGSHHYIQQQMAHSFLANNVDHLPSAIIIQWPNIYRTFLYDFKDKTYKIETMSTKNKTIIKEKVSQNYRYPQWEFRCSYIMTHHIASLFSIPVIEFSTSSVAIDYDYDNDHIDASIKNIPEVDQCDYADDKQHPGLASNIKFSSYIHSQLRRLNI